MLSTSSHFILNRKSRNYIIHVSRKLWLYQEVKWCFLKPKDPFFCHIATELPNFQSTPAPLNILPCVKLTIPRIGACFFIGDFFSWLWQHFTIVYVINKKKQIKIILVGKESAVDKCIALKCALSKSSADHMHDKAITSIWMVLLFNKMTFKPSLFTTSIFLIIFNFQLFFISLSMTSIASIHL